MDCSPPGSSVHGILQARIVEWVVIFFSRGSSWPRDQTWVSCIAGRFCTIWATRNVKSLSWIRIFATPWTVAYQAPPSMGFSRQECWSTLPFSFPGDLPDPGIKPGSPAFQADSLPSELWGKIHTAWHSCKNHLNKRETYGEGDLWLRFPSSDYLNLKDLLTHIYGI